MKSIEERVAEIKDKHTRGYNCAQIVLCSYAEELGYELVKEKKYKTNKHVFLKKKEG